MKLSNLSTSEIDKLDLLLFFLKNNDKGFNNIMTFCIEKWGINYSLYQTFSDCLVDNNLTIKSNYSEYEQVISSDGKNFISFKKAYKTEKNKNYLQNINEYLDYFSKPILTIITIVTAFFGVYQYITAKKYDTVIKEQKNSIDSLNKVVQSLKMDSINKLPILKDKIEKVLPNKNLP